MSAPRTQHRQREHQVRLEWGPRGLELLAADCAVVIVVDVLSFCTSVDIAVGRGVSVLPRPYGDAAADERAAAARGAITAGARHGPGPSLRPSSLVGLNAGSTIALPSPNGATLCAAAATWDVVLLAGCLRNASAIAAAAAAVGGPIGLVPAGERWPDGTLRVAVEDTVGAGAIAAGLPAADRSPEAELAVAQFVAARDRGLAGTLAASSSGRELVADGFGADITLAAALDTSDAVPRLRDGVLADR